MQMKMFPSQEMTLIGAVNISQPYLSTKGINNFAVSHLNKDMEKLKITLLVIVIRINPGLIVCSVYMYESYNYGQMEGIKTFWKIAAVSWREFKTWIPFFPAIVSATSMQKTPVGPVKS